MSVFDRARNWLAARIMQEPSTFVEGGGNADESFHEKFKRSREQLDEFEAVYQRGGPVAQLVDTRALMSFGTGVEFTSSDERDLKANIDGEEMTITEWLEAEFDQLDDLLVQLAKDAYIYGDALGEIVEEQGGGFSHVELVNPKTMEPEWDDHGTIQRWVQEIERGGGRTRTQEFDADEVAHFKLHRVGRRPIGISLIEQNWDEIQRFAANQEAVQNALKLHGFPKYHVRVGKQDSAQVVNDPQLRRVRSRFRNFDEKTNWVTGTDIAIDSIDTGETHIEGVTDHDLMVLAAGFGVPEEMAGLGRGSTEATAKVRLQSFERMARSEQRVLANQFIEQVVRPVITRFSPFPNDADLGIEFGDVVSDQTATAEWLAQFREYYTVDEVREKLGDSPAPEDEELGPPQPAGAMGEAQGAGVSMPGPAPGGVDAGNQTADASATPQENDISPVISRSIDASAAPSASASAEPARALSDGGREMAVERERVYVNAPSDAPEDARVLSDDGGGLYYLRESPQTRADPAPEPATRDDGVRRLGNW